MSLSNGGDEGDRTLDLRIANAALSQLSYVPEERPAIQEFFPSIKTYPCWQREAPGGNLQKRDKP